MDRKRRSEVKGDLRAVENALRRWDPIGVRPGPADDEGPLDEYDGYAPKVLALLQRGCTASEIAAHLDMIRQKTMGLPSNATADAQIAQQLVDEWSRRS